MSKSKLVNYSQQHNALTANGAVTHSTSLKSTVDMFFIAGATRSMSENDILKLFKKAFAEDTTIALKCLFWARDIRGGAGERRFFRVIWKYLHDEKPDIFWRLISFVPEYGRFDDVFEGIKIDENLLKYISDALATENKLFAKWFPRKGPYFSALHKHTGVTPKELRKFLVHHTQVVETQMCNKEWGAITYPHVPSVAMNKYRKAFFKNDAERFNMYIESVKKGETKINASAIFPHDLVKKFISGGRYSGRNVGDLSVINLPVGEEKAIEAQWDALPNYMKDSTERILPLCDVSGSMLTPDYLPMSVSIALGIYISQHNRGIFENAVMTFTNKPTTYYLKGLSLKDKIGEIALHCGYNTDFAEAFAEILRVAKANKLTQEDLPTKILAISDMEFDSVGGRRTNFEAIKQMFSSAGYEMPTLIFWNVNGRLGNVPANIYDKVGLVSGFSPAILTSILGGEIGGPEQLMLLALMSERYAKIV